MWDKWKLISAVSGKSLSVTAILGAWLFLAQGAYALTADEVLNKMGDDERFAYVSGIVDGLAFARWLADKPDESGMKCIHNWYYDEDTEVDKTLMTWLQRHADKPVDALVYVLIKKECGE